MRRIIALCCRLAPMPVAGLLPFFLMCLTTTAVAGTLVLPPLALPPLGNTAEGDRLLLREIGDQHVYQPFPEITAPNASRATGNAVTNVSNTTSRPSDVVRNAWNLVAQSRRLRIAEHERITYYLQQYRIEAFWVNRILARAQPFIGHVVDELDKRFLPIELALLPAIESGYQPDVRSSQNAAGIWQIVPTTAAEVGLPHNLWFDARLDIRQSTTGALDYLSYLNAEFHGNWLLTLAAYNAGLGRVRAAITRNTQAGLPIDFWSLELPLETREYVPKFLALVVMFRQSEAYGLTLDEVPRGDAFDLVDVKQRVSLNRLAAFTGIDEPTLRLLNTGLVHEITPPEGPHAIYVPRDSGMAMLELLQANSVVLYDKPDVYTVVAGDTISSISRQYRISETQLARFNALESDLIKIGQKLKIVDLANTQPQVEYFVTIGDTLSDIAQRFGVRITEIRDEKGRQLPSDIIHPGDRLSLPLRD